MAFKIQPVTIEALGQQMIVKTISVSRMLEYREKYNKLGDDDMAGIIKLMTEAIKEMVIDPKITDEELDAIGTNGLRTVFDAVAVACGLSAEKNAVGNKTT
jgi:hypothetical protein